MAPLRSGTSTSRKGRKMRKPQRFHLRYATLAEPTKVAKKNVTAVDPACALGLLLDESDDVDLQLLWVVVVVLGADTADAHDDALTSIPWASQQGALAQIDRAVLAGLARSGSEP